jgi:uncharacterized repeat protein (TIGR03803 family)
LTTLYSFCTQTGCPDGEHPYAGLVQGTDGHLYGITTGSVDDSNYGTVFKITPSGTLTTLYHFCSQADCADGGLPQAALIPGTDGDFFGTTAYALGSLLGGTVFKITPSGTLTTLHTFCSEAGCADGANSSGLVQDINGELYATTQYGGANCPPSGCGTVFSLSENMGPFVKTLPTSGEVGAAVTILGTDLTGATGVTFNGTPAASFTVTQSGSAIRSAVPVGASSGEAQVVLPNRTLSSNVPFQVLP